MAKVIINFFKEILANSVCSAEEKKVMLAEFEECYNDSFVNYHEFRLRAQLVASG